MLLMLNEIRNLKRKNQSIIKDFNQGKLIEKDFNQPMLNEKINYKIHQKLYQKLVMKNLCLKYFLYYLRAEINLKLLK